MVLVAGETAGVAAAKEVCLVRHEGVIVFSCYLRNKTLCTGHQHTSDLKAAAAHLDKHNMVEQWDMSSSSRILLLSSD